MRPLILLFSLLVIALLLIVPADMSAESAAEPAVACSSEMSGPQLETRGEDFRSTKQYGDAIKCFNLAVVKAPRSSGLQNKIGITYLLSSDYRAAETHFQKALKLDSKNVNALNNLGVIAYVSRNYGKAINYYKKSLALDETNASAHSNLGSAWFAQKKLERAMAEYTRAMELDPDIMVRSSENGITARVISVEERAKYSYLLAKLYAKRGDVDRCLQCLRKAKEEGYGKMNQVYVDEEFASVRQDARLSQIVPPPQMR